MAERAEYEAVQKSLVEINEDLGGADPKSMVPALLGKKLINPNDGQKIELEKTDIDRAQLIGSTLLKKVNASPQKMFANFLTFLKDHGLDELLNTVITNYVESGGDESMLPVQSTPEEHVSPDPTPNKKQTNPSAGPEDMQASAEPIVAEHAFKLPGPDMQESIDPAKAEQAFKPSERTESWIIERSEVCLTGPTLGEGGWGEVQVAIFREIKVAAKILRKDISPSYHDIFKREIEMASRIRHPNLVQFIAASSDQMVILTELMSKSLHDHLYEHTPKIPPETFRVSVSLDVAKALHYLHHMKPDPIIHRDISSANVLLECLTADTYKAKVSDYGTLNIEKKITTKSPGCPPYSAPEAQEPSKQSVKMDIFSFGVLVLEQCTAVFPDKDARASMIISIKETKWKDLINKCIHFDPTQRPKMSQIISRLTTWMN